MSTLFTYTGCNNDDEGNSKVNLLIGTWTITDVNLVADIGDKSVKDYLMDIGGLSEIKAQAYTILFESLLASTFNGTIQFKDNNTYESNVAGEVDDGTWSLNSAGDKITMDAGTSEETVITIITLTENTLKLSLNTSELANVDDESMIPDFDISIAVEMTLTK